MNFTRVQAQPHEYSKAIALLKKYPQRVKVTISRPKVSAVILGRILETLEVVPKTSLEEALSLGMLVSISVLLVLITSSNFVCM